MRRKVIHIGIILTGFVLTGCGSQSVGNIEPSRVQIVETVTNIEPSQMQLVETVTNIETTDSEEAATNSHEEISTEILSEKHTESETQKEESYPRMVKLNDKLYADTGETSNMARCGVMDFSFDSSVKDGIPAENNQTNFGKGYEGQYGMRENRIEICIDDVWHIFAYNENNFEGVDMKVTSNTNQSLILEIYHNTDCQVEYGEDYSLEKWDEEYKNWMPVHIINDNVAFPSIAYIAEKDKVTEWSVNWKNIYGKLEKGKYRIVKVVLDYKEEGGNIFHTLMSEFECE